MTVKEKIDFAAQAGKLYLFKEGLFYRVYNGQAMLFIKHIKAYKVGVRYVKNVAAWVYGIGFQGHLLTQIMGGG